MQSGLVDLARVAVEKAHPFSGFGRSIHPKRRDFVLQFETEKIVVAISLVVQKAAHRRQKPLRAFDRFQSLADASLVLREQRQPVQQMDIAKTAGSFFDVGLQMIDCVIKFGVPLGRHGGQFTDEPIFVLLVENGERVREPLKQIGTAVLRSADQAS